MRPQNYDSLYSAYERLIDIPLIKDVLKEKYSIYLDTMFQYDTSFSIRTIRGIYGHILFNNGIYTSVSGAQFYFDAYGEFYFREKYPNSRILYWYLKCNY